MGLIKSIKKSLVTRKKKAKSWQEKAKQNLVVAAILIPLVLAVAAFTIYGAHFGQYMVDKNPKASWAKDLQWRTAKLYQFWGSYYWAAMGYEKLYTNYRLTPQELIEVEYREASCMRDGEQYASALAKLDVFVEKYKMSMPQDNWYQKGFFMWEALKVMEDSKRIDRGIWAF